MKKTLSLLLSLVLIITSTFCLSFTASADDSLYSYDEQSKTLTVTGTANGEVYQSTFDDFDYKDETVRIDLSKSVETVGNYAFKEFTALKKLVVFNQGCELSKDGVMPNNNVTVYSFENSTAQAHAKNHGYNFMHIYNISFTKMGEKTPTIVHVLEDYTVEELAKSAPQFSFNPLHSKSSGKDTYCYWTPALVAPAQKPNARYTEDYKTDYCTDHASTVVTKEPTCTKVGESQLVCDICGNVLETNEIKATGHDFGTNNELEFCKKCGERNLDYTTTTTTQPSTETTTQPTTSATTTVVPTTTAPATTAATSPATQATTKAVSKPKGTKIKKLTKGKKQLSVTWSKISGVKGYQIQVATDKKFKKNKKTVTIKKQKTTKATVKKLKTKKKYYVRVRTYKVVNKKNVYSSWSSVKTVKTK